PSRADAAARPARVAPRPRRSARVTARADLTTRAAGADLSARAAGADLSARAPRAHLTARAARADLAAHATQPDAATPAAGQPPRAAVRVSGVLDPAGREVSDGSNDRVAHPQLEQRAARLAVVGLPRDGRSDRHAAESHGERARLEEGQPRRGEL